MEYEHENTNFEGEAEKSKIEKLVFKDTRLIAVAL